MVDLPLPDCPTSARTRPGSMLRLNSLQEQRDHHYHCCLKGCGGSPKAIAASHLSFELLQGQPRHINRQLEVYILSSAAFTPAAELVAAASAW